MVRWRLPQHQGRPLLLRWLHHFLWLQHCLQQRSVRLLRRLGPHLLPGPKVLCRRQLGRSPLRCLLGRQHRLPHGGRVHGGSCGCPTGLTHCTEAKACVDLNSDAAHCGACTGTHSVCAVGALCTNGDCGCPGGGVVCGNTCTQLGTNTDCASCGNACPVGGFCGAVGSQKTCVCPAGYTNCNGTCFDLKTDFNHCGSCTATACATGASCSDGKCECGENQQVCGGTCVDVQNSTANCKKCGQACTVACSARLARPQPTSTRART